MGPKILIPWREEGLKILYSLQGHVPNDLTSFHWAPQLSRKPRKPSAFPQSLHICLNFIHHSSLSVTSCELETPGWPSLLPQGPGHSNHLNLPQAFCLSWPWFTSAICKLISNASHKWVMPGLYHLNVSLRPSQFYQL